MQFFSLRLLTLIAAIGLALRVQALWITNDPLEIFFSYILWLPLIIDWIVRQLIQEHRGNPIERREWIAPLGLVFVLVCGVTHARLRAVFWTQLGELEAAEKKPPVKQGIGDPLHAFQLAKSHGDTRFLLWEDWGTAVGFVHCPNDAGCEGARFWDYWDYSKGTPEPIHPPLYYEWNSEHYGDYSHGTAIYLYMGRDWYATQVRVEADED